MAEHILLSGGAKIIPIEVKSEGYVITCAMPELNRTRSGVEP